jgi:hypothetical protein
MPPRTNDFQQLVHLIESQLSPHDATVTESKEFIDHVTGVKRAVDITIERKSGIHNFVIGIECIDHKRPADAPWIEKIANKYEDLNVDKIIVVSGSGFYRPALAIKVLPSTTPPYPPPPLFEGLDTDIYD